MGMTASLTQTNQGMALAGCTSLNQDELTKAEVAAHFRVTTRTITDWVTRLGLPCVKISRRTVRFKRSAVEEWSQMRSSQCQTTAGW